MLPVEVLPVTADVHGPCSSLTLPTGGGISSAWFQEIVAYLARFP